MKPSGHNRKSSRSASALGRRNFRLRPARVALGAVAIGLGIWVGASTQSGTEQRPDVSFGRENAVVLAKQSLDLLQAGDVAAAELQAVKVVSEDPTAVNAIVVLGIARMQAGKQREAAGLLKYAMHLSRRNTPTNLWAIEYYVDRNDIPSILRTYDIALRTSLRMRDTLFPILSGSLSEAEISRSLIDRLRGKPLWAESFLTYVASNSDVPVGDATRFLVSAQHYGVNAPPSSLAVLVRRSLLDDNRDIDVAWRAYQLKRPGVSRTQIRDMNFKNASQTPTLFDWTPVNGGGISTQTITTRGETYFSVEAGSGVVGMATQQAQVLPIGRYRILTDVSKIILAGGEIYWTMTCDNGDKIFDLSLKNREGTSAADFVITRNCRYQLLKLQIVSGESSGGSKAEFKSVQIRPVLPSNL